jgi:hypothetical protein
MVLLVMVLGKKPQRWLLGGASAYGIVLSGEERMNYV